MAARVTVSDQSVDGGQLTIAQVDSPGAGWLVVHAQADGKPGAVLGYSAVKAGTNTNVVVTVDDSEATAVLYAMLHTDAGTVGTYEFPGADGPVSVNGEMVSPSFNVTGGLSLSSSTRAPADNSNSEDYGEDTAKTQAPGTTTGMEVKVSSNAALGKFLVDEDGMTLYLFTKDTPGVSNCSGNCLTAWPPLLTVGSPRADDGVVGKLDTITLADGTLQVTYNDMPLYYYISDVNPGDTVGQNVGGVWFVVAP
jgi:predicted lipoprotein with Yx(FWY)xxD motif